MLSGLSVFQDRNTLWHDKPASDGRPSSNNWMFYTGVAKLLGLSYDEVAAYRYFNKCAVLISSDRIEFRRHPDMKNPPVSFDEFFGAYILGFISYDKIKGNHMVYNGRGKAMNEGVFHDAMKAIAEYTVAMNLKRLFNKKIPDRNLWWKMKLQNVSKFATRLNPAQSYVVKKFAGKNFHNEEEKIWAWYRGAVMKSKNSKDRIVLWVFLVMVGDDKRARKMKIWKDFQKVFPSNHPFNYAVKRRYGIK